MLLIVKSGKKLVGARGKEKGKKKNFFIIINLNMTFMMRVQLMEERKRKYQREMVLEECTFNLVCHDRKCQMIPVCNCECKVSPIVHVSHDRK